jgi:hypothetical protein
MSYNTSIHPQDCELEVSSTDDSDYGPASNASKRRTNSRSVEGSLVRFTNQRTMARRVGSTQVSDNEPGHEMISSERGKWPFTCPAYPAHCTSLRRASPIN